MAGETTYCERCGDRLWEPASEGDALCDACRDEIDAS